MANFETSVALSLEIPRSELRSARSAIEGGLSDVSVSGGGGGAAARATGGGSGGRQGKRMFRWARERTSYLETMVGQLDGIEDKVGGGGGGGGGFLGGFGARSIVGGIGGALGGGAITGALSVAASKVISLSKSAWSAAKVIAIGKSKWVASALLSITKSTWAASKLITITASTWAASKIIAVGSLLKVGAASLITTGALMTVGAASLITVGTLLTLDAMELIQLDELIEADWDDVVTLKGSVPYEAGQDFQESNPGLADFIHTGFTNNPIHDLGEMTGEWLRNQPEPTIESMDRTQEATSPSGVFGSIGDPNNIGGKTVNVDNSTQIDVQAPDTTEQIKDEIRKEQEREREQLERRIQRAMGGRSTR